MYKRSDNLPGGVCIFKRRFSWGASYFILGQVIFILGRVNFILGRVNFILRPVILSLGVCIREVTTFQGGCAYLKEVEIFQGVEK